MGMTPRGRLPRCFEQRPALGWLLGIKRNLPEIHTVRCPVGEMEQKEQEGAVGTCSLSGFWGAEQLRVTPTTAWSILDPK